MNEVQTAKLGFRDHLNNLFMTGYDLGLLLFNLKCFIYFY